MFRIQPAIKEILYFPFLNYIFPLNACLLVDYDY